MDWNGATNRPVSMSADGFTVKWESDEYVFSTTIAGTVYVGTYSQHIAAGGSIQVNSGSRNGYFIADSDK